MRYFSYPVSQDIKKTDNIKCWQRESHCSHDCCWKSGKGFWHLCWEIWQYQSICPFIPKIQWILKKWARKTTTLHQSWSLHRQTELPARKCPPRGHDKYRAAPTGCSQPKPFCGWDLGHAGNWASGAHWGCVQGTAPYTSRKSKPWCYDTWASNILN